MNGLRFLQSTPSAAHEPQMAAIPPHRRRSVTRAPLDHPVPARQPPAFARRGTARDAIASLEFERQSCLGLPRLAGVNRSAPSTSQRSQPALAAGTMGLLSAGDRSL